MTDDFDFDFDVDRGRAASRTEPGEPEETNESPGPRKRFRNGNGNGNGARTNGSNGNGSGNGSRDGGRGYADRAKQLFERRGELLYDDEEDDAPPAPPARPPRREPPPEPEVPRRPGEPADDDWLSFGGDVFEPGSLSPLRERDDGPAGPPTPGEARNFAKEARRRASRRPSSILDFDEERARLEQTDGEEKDEDADFESVLAAQPQKGRVARRGTALRNAFEHSFHSLRRVGGERIAESRDRVSALRERVPARIGQPRPAGAGKPPPPGFLAGSARAVLASPSLAASRSSAC